MVFTDYYGGGLFIVKADGKLDFKIPMKGNKTFAVTVVDCTTVAVSSGKPYSNDKACIRITDIQSRGVTKTIYTESWCYGIVFADDKLVFCGYEPSGIFEIDLKTNTQSVISSTIPLSNWSNISYVEKKFYVTNASTRTITCCGNKGNVLWTYNDNVNMKAIRGFSVDTNGNAFVASENLKNVTMISHDGKRAKQILDTKDGLDAPYAMQYDRYTNRLLVANQKGMAYLFGEQ
ncbi:unnamed protein product [Mytilus edulis]|uniref:Uncharacterized protein n=1 Tax=Mytilus edulis TaxID=6550 RepID=A0A8S3S2X8_MYTED|nr:unnamed protein product [Mytilus edulis]